jgi:ABC-type transport system involved in cytochrome c biogenesis permease subunit
VFLLATASLTLAVIARGISAERIPLGNMYEYSITGAMTFALAYLIIGLKFDLSWLGLPSSILILLILGTAITLLYRPSAPLVPALQSSWLVIHVSSAILSGGIRSPVLIYGLIVLKEKAREVSLQRSFHLLRA